MTPPSCSDCQQPLRFVREINAREVEHEARGTSSGFSLPIASSLWLCERERAYFRYYITGCLEKLPETSPVLTIRQQLERFHDGVSEYADQTNKPHFGGEACRTPGDRLKSSEV